MKNIGGFFELELPKGDDMYHKEYSFLFKTGRSSLRYILERVNAKKIYLAYYSCHVVLEPLEALGIDYEFYEVDQYLELKESLNLDIGEYFIYINYFGLKSNYVSSLEKQYSNQLIVDNTQAFFYKPRSKKAWYFNSCRKFLGVADGSFVYKPSDFPKDNSVFERNKDFITEHLISRLEGNIEKGYQWFLKNEELLNDKVELISIFSELLLSNIDYQKIVNKRIENYQFLHTHLGNKNQQNKICAQLGDQIPFCYPYLPKMKIDKKELWKMKVFVPILWKECLDKEDGFIYEKELVKNFIHLPIDHRYEKKDLELVITKIEEIEQRITT